MNAPFISICIPAYKRIHFLKRLLESITIQTLKDYEVIITDDSTDNSVLQLIDTYRNRLNLYYYKNETPLGTPANWNYGISKAKGQWIKIMHDDDWLATEKSLERFARETHSNRKFIFSSYNNVTEGTQPIQEMSFPAVWKKRIIQNPLTLLSWNVIGPPSVTLVHRSIAEQYDTRMKWRVDIDFYVRVLKQEKTFAYIEEPLVNVGISGSQVTNYCLNQPEVELPEGLLLLQKYGVQPLKNILVYDTWWRIIRNAGVRNTAQLAHYTTRSEWPVVILKIVGMQSHIPLSVLKIGVLSKICMCLSYLFYYRYLNRYK